MPIKRSIGALGILFAAISSIIGAGWLLVPYYAVQMAGPAAIVSWLIGGSMSIVIAFTFAELATLFPVTGSMVYFTQLSHGTLAGFTFSWISWLSCVIIAPLEVLAILQYCSNFLPWLTYETQGTHLLTMPGIMAAMLVMLIMSGINIIGAKALARTNIGIGWLKLALPVIMSLALMIASGFSFKHLQALGPFAPNGLKGILTALPVAGIVFAYNGFTAAVALAGESANPQRNLPLAIIGSLVVATILYTLVQIAFLGAIDPQWLKAGGWSHLSFAGSAGPFAGISASLGLGWLVLVLYASAIISPFGTGLAFTMATARINYAMGLQHYMPAIMLGLNDKGIPVKAIMVNFIIGMLLFLPLPSWQSMVSFLAGAMVISYAVGPLALLALRDLLPTYDRPFRLPYATIFAFLAFYICNLIVYWTGWDTVWRMLFAIGLGYLLLAFSRRNIQQRAPLQLKSLGWLAYYFFGLGIISYLGPFGGRGAIVFGWDFLIIALFSAIILRLSFKARNSQENLNALLAEAKV